MDNIFELVENFELHTIVGNKDYRWGFPSGTNKQPVHLFGYLEFILLIVYYYRISLKSLF